MKSVNFVGMKIACLILLLTIATLTSNAQEINESINNTGIYEFLDEMAGLGVIRLNSCVKPYTRDLIADKLVRIRETASAGTVILNHRQQQELQFYMQSYRQEIANPANKDQNTLVLAKNAPGLILALNPAGLHYRDSLFRFSLEPVIGGKMITNGNGNGYIRYWGGSLKGYIGKNAGFFVELRDHHATEPPTVPDYLDTEQGYVYKHNDNNSVDFTGTRGGLTGAVSWGSVGILVDRISWGDGYHGANILSGKIPPVPYLQMRLHPVKWFDFNYFHAWLNSNVIDSSRSYYINGEYRIVYRNKFMAANMFTFTPWRGLNVSVGNSVVYSDQNLNPLYFIPFLFFNAVDAVKNNYDNDAGSNSQLFFNISSRNIRRWHIYFSLFIDEWKNSRFLDPELHNFTSLKVGFKASDLFHRNLSFLAEYTRTQPMTYKHFITSATFASNDYNMGHYLKDNAEEIYLELSWKPYRGVMFRGAWTTAIRGDDIEYNYNAGYQVDKIPFIQNKTWQNNSFELSARFEFTANGSIGIRYLHSVQSGLPQYQSPLMTGTTDSFSAGICLGL